VFLPLQKATTITFIYQYNLFNPGSLPLHKATIMPRGQALGMVSQLPESDELQWTKKQLLARLDVCMAGRVAEEVIFGKENVTTGALKKGFKFRKCIKFKSFVFCA
jgi:ATP-dependent Zn protease